MLAAVNPVTQQVKHHQVDQKTHDRAVGHAGPELVQVKSAVTFRAQRTKSLVKPGLQREKQGNAKHTQPVYHRVQHVGAYGGAVQHWLHWPPALQRPDHRQQNSNLNQAHHEPGGGFIAVFQQVAQAQRKHGRLHGQLEQPLLHRRKVMTQGFHAAYFAAFTGGAPAAAAIQAL